MLNEDLLRRLLVTFADEAEEHVSAIGAHLLALEKQPDHQERPQLLVELFREAHSLKGAARAVNVPGVATLAHGLETLFGRLQSGELAARQALFDAAYEALDAIGAMVHAAAGGPAADVDVNALERKLQQLGAAAEQTGQTGSSEGPGRPAAPIAPRQTEPAQQAGTVSGGTAQLPAPASETTPRGHGETIRVAVNKLDTLLAQIGELQVARVAAEQQLADVRALLDGLELWELQWRQVRQHFGRLRHNLDRTAPTGEAGSGAAQPDGYYDDLRVIVGFLQAHEGRQQARRTQLTELRRSLEAGNRRMAQIASELQDSVRRVRMLPISTVFDAFPRMVRDLAAQLGGQVHLQIEGGETQLDRSVLEQIKAPLTHLLRNAVDHGIEPPAERQARGKPAQATITLSAAQRGDTILIEVADDGAGIDIAQLRASAVRAGSITAEAAAAMSDREALWLVFQTGLTTRDTVSDLSGRGIGLDVVRAAVERLRGLIEVESRLGRGTRFSLHLPLTVATTHCLLAEVAGHTIALPIANVLRLMPVEAAVVGRVTGREVLRDGARPIPLVRLAAMLAGAADDAATPGVAQAMPAAIVVGAAEKRIAFVVDRLLDIHELVVKSLPAPLQRVRYIAGATIIGSGKVALVLNIAELLRAATPAHPEPRSPAAAQQAAPLPVIMVVDDSSTTRSLQRNILESAGYRVRIAADGVEAWEALHDGGCDLLITDVEMPRMDGFELTSKLRSDERFRHLPVILVTSLDSLEDRRRGIAVGADAHIAKGGFDQATLLETVRQLI